MAQKYSKEQFWKLYKTLPEELKDAVFADETGEHIYEVSERNKVTAKLPQIVELTGRVLIGLLPAEEFSEALQKEVKIKKAVAEKVAREINRFVFYPVKPALDQLHTTKVTVTAPSIPIQQPTPKKESTSTPQRKDLYRETIEEEK